MKINTLDLPLLRAFVERECRDFWNPNVKRTEEHAIAHERAIETAMKGIEEKLATLEKAYCITFVSCTNLGLVIRSLELPLDGLDPATRIECLFDTAKPGRFAFAEPDCFRIKDVAGTFGDKGAL